jgi:uncharacterized membrane protein
LWLLPTLIYVLAVGAVGVSIPLALRTLRWTDVVAWTAVAYVLVAIGLVGAGQVDPRFGADTWWAIASGVLLVGSLIALNLALATGEASSVIPVSSAYPLVTLILAALVLSERVTPWRCVGTAVVVAGVVLISTTSRDGDGRTPGRPSSRPGGYLVWLVPTLGFACAVGALGVTSRLALRTLEWPDLVAWNAVVYAVAACGLLAVRRASLRAAAGRSWALASGALAVGSVIALYLALGVGEASRVIPVSAGYPVVTLLLVATFMAEAVSAQRWGGTALVIGGVILITAA